MLVLGLQGSPRGKGNTAYLLDLFLGEARRFGARTETIEAAVEPVTFCKGCGACEKKGVCVSRDVMAEKIFPLLRQADVVVTASPVYFYGISAQLKAIVDRCQTLWSRKHRLKLTDPGAAVRRGVLLSVAASQGQQLFDGIHLTARYFYDAVAAVDSGSLVYRGIEKAGDMAAHSGAAMESATLAQSVLAPLADRRPVVFCDAGVAGGGLIAAAWARYLAGDRLDVYAAADLPDEQTTAVLTTAMADRGIDIGYYRPQPPAQTAVAMTRTVAVGDDRLAEATDRWHLAPPAPGSVEAAAALVEKTGERVRRFIDHFDPPAG